MHRDGARIVHRLGNLFGDGNRKIRMERLLLNGGEKGIECLARPTIDRQERENGHSYYIAKTIHNLCLS